jgi:hypothetical protein
MWCGGGVFLGAEKHATDFNFIFRSTRFRDVGCARDGIRINLSIAAVEEEGIPQGLKPRSVWED